MTTDSSMSCLDLSALAVVDARGTDAATFLQGQLTNDLAGTGAGRACLAGYCTPKGRLLALMLVTTLPGGALRLIVPRELLEGLLQRLRMFVMRADVVFETRDDLRCRGFAVAADTAPDAVLEHGVSALPAVPPGEVLELVGGADGSDAAQICRWHDAEAPSPCRRYLLVCGADEGVAADGSAEEGEAIWRLGDISAGVPRIAAATREAFVPQMVNLQLIDGLSFRKGCYPGQEIVARMQYLGKLKRHMRRFRTPGTVADSGPEIAPGDALEADGDGDAGRVVDAVRTDAGTELLAVVKLSTPPGALRAGGVALEPLELPYALPQPEPAEAPADTPTNTGGAPADSS